MLLRTIVVVFFMGCGLLQVHAQSEENENFHEEFLPGERETSGDGRDLPGDDEDMIDVSGEGSSVEIYDDIIPIGNPAQPGDNNDDITGKDENEIDVHTDLEERIPEDKSKVNGLMSSQFVAALIIGGCVGLLFAICVILLLLYRMRKKDEGSYAIDDEKKASNGYQYTQGQQEYYA